MSSSGQWEVVGNKSSKNKPTNEGKLSKGQKKKYVEHMPKLDEVSPIQESPTIFRALIEPEKKREQTQVAKLNGIMENKSKKVAQQQKKKGHMKTKGQQQKTVSFEEIVSELRAAELKGLLDEVQAHFQDTPSIWLKDLASYLNLKVNVEPAGAVFSDKPSGYPCSLLSPPIREILMKTMSQCTNSILKHFFEYCIHSMVQDMAKGQSTFGYRVFLQYIGQEKPDIITSSLGKCTDLRTSYQNRQNICLSILWAAGQAGTNNMKSGLKVWLELMLPVIGLRAYSKYTIEYLSELLRSHHDVFSASEVLGVNELLSILDFIYSPSGLAGNLQKQLQSLYSRLKKLSYGPNPETALRNYFLSYLCRLQPSCSEGMKQQLLSSLVECLLYDKHCYSVWRQLYTKNLVQSSMLMQHLLIQWDTLPTSFPQKLLKETLSTFKVTNDEISLQCQTGQEGFEDSIKYCNELLAKMSAWKFPWRHLLFILFLAVGAFLVYDVNLHGSFQRSRTGKFMKNAGILAAYEQACGRIIVYTQKSRQWLEKNIPVYYTKVCSVCKPYLELFWENLFLLCAYIWESTHGVREWLTLKVPPLLDWISKHLPLYFEMVINFVGEMWKVLYQHSVWMWAYILHYLNIAGIWLQHNVFIGKMSPENLQRYAVYIIEMVQQYAGSLFRWCNEQLSTMISSK